MDKINTFEWKLDPTSQLFVPTSEERYEIGKVELWLHDNQKNNKLTRGSVIYEYLKEKDMLVSCFSLRDLLFFHSKGVVFFRQHFAGMAIFAWGGIGWSPGGDRYVPFLCENYDDTVWLGKQWIEHSWGINMPALRFKNPDSATSAL